jgi:hypothetical protein
VDATVLDVLSANLRSFEAQAQSLGLDADPVIDRGLNSLLAAKITFHGLH